MNKILAVGIMSLIFCSMLVSAFPDREVPTRGMCLKADLNKDGEVTIADYMIARMNNDVKAYYIIEATYEKCEEQLAFKKIK